MRRLQLAFYLRGTEIVVHYSLLLPVIWAVAGDRLWELALLCGALLTHELAHLLVINGYGLKLHRVIILPIGARMEISGLSDRMDLEAPVALAGPLNNFFLLGLGLLVGSTGVVDGYLWEFFLSANLVLAMFNLIPVLPLDGGRLLRSYLGETVGLVQAERMMAHWGTYWGLGFVALAAYLAIRYDLFLWVLCAMGVLLMIHSRSQLSQLSVRSLQNLYHRKRNAEKRVHPPHIEHIPAYSSETVVSVSKRFGRHGYAIIWVLDESLILVGTLTEQQLRAAVNEGKARRSLGELLDKQ